MTRFSTMPMKKLLPLLSVLAALGASAPTTLAAPVPLNSLIGNGSIQLGDKIFGDFGFQSAVMNSTGVDVEATIGPTGIYYLTFTGPFLSSGQAIDVTVRYSVSTSTGLPLIAGIDQAFELTISGNGGFVLIGETVRADSYAGPTVAQSSLSHAGTFSDLEDPDAEPLTGDQLVVSPTRSKVWVTKDIFFLANPGGIVGPTKIIQSFHQTTVPEGGTLMMMVGLTLAGLGVARRQLEVR